MIKVHSYMIKASFKVKLKLSLSYHIDAELDTFY